jgi:probable HAF family extracellular repeat protein
MGDATEIGFSYDGFTFAPIIMPGKSATIALGINNAGVIVGGDGSVNLTRGYELRGQHFRYISPPGQFVYVFAAGINRSGEIVGWATSSGEAHGFRYKSGVYQRVMVPGSLQTVPWDVDDSGAVVGWYQVGPSAFGFTLRNGKYSSFAYPAAKATFATGLNAIGEMVGQYTLDYLTYHGFVAAPSHDGAEY